MPKSSVETYSLIELSPNSTSSNPNLLQIPSNNEEIKTKNTEPYPPEHGSAGRVRFLEPLSANNTKPSLSKPPKTIPSLESVETSSLENINDLHQDGPNSVSRGDQTDISSPSVIDWVLAQKSSLTGDRYIKTQFISDMMHKYT
jgi:hypothetical protein